MQTVVRVGEDQGVGTAWKDGGAWRDSQGEKVANPTTASDFMLGHRDHGRLAFTLVGLHTAGAHDIVASHTLSGSFYRPYDISAPEAYRAVGFTMKS